VLAGEPAMFQPLPPETALPLEGLGTALIRGVTPR
jgi:hypothetical protein